MGTIVNYSYDTFGCLTGSKADQFEKLFRTADEVGNLYERRDRSDRVYGVGSRLEQSGMGRKEQGTQYQPGRQEVKGASNGKKFFYDKEGNLTKKKEGNGDEWFYAYYGNGMLKNPVTRKPTSIGA